MECGVCFRWYKDEGDRRPRSLSCGHSFCSACLCSIIQEDGLVCPTCRNSHEVFKVEDIAVNYGLLDILKIVGTPEEEEARSNSKDEKQNAPSTVECPTPVPDDCCAEHGELWQYRCVPCDKWMCSRCLVVEHLDKGCRVISSKQALEELLQIQKGTSVISLKFYDTKIVKLAQYESLMEFHLQKQEMLLNGLAEVIEKQNHVIKLVREERERLQSAVEEGKIKRNALDFSIERTNHADTQREFSHLLKEIRNWDAKLSDWVKTSAEPLEESETKNISLKDCPIPLIAKGGLAKVLSQQLVVGTAALRLSSATEDDIGYDEAKEQKEGVYAIMEGEEGEVRSARVSMSGGHVLLHALENGPPPVESLTLQYSSVRHLTSGVSTPVCFLSVSKDETHLGRIYIRVLSPSKRSHQFRLLCTGERGPCYKGSAFFSVQKAGEPGECILGGDYNRGDGTGGSPLLDGIKPGPEYREIVSEGLVAGSNGDHSALFGIFLRDWSGVSDTAFARVIKNLRLLQLAAISFKDIRHLKVSDCGVVIPI